MGRKPPRVRHVFNQRSFQAATVRERSERQYAACSRALGEKTMRLHARRESTGMRREQPGGATSSKRSRGEGSVTDRRRGSRDRCAARFRTLSVADAREPLIGPAETHPLRPNARFTRRAVGGHVAAQRVAGTTAAGAQADIVGAREPGQAGPVRAIARKAVVAASRCITHALGDYAGATRTIEVTIARPPVVAADRAQELAVWCRRRAGGRLRSHRSSGAAVRSIATAGRQAATDDHC